MLFTVAYFFVLFTITLLVLFTSAFFRAVHAKIFVLFTKIYQFMPIFPDYSRLRWADFTTETAVLFNVAGWARIEFPPVEALIVCTQYLQKPSPPMVVACASMPSMGNYLCLQKEILYFLAGNNCLEGRIFPLYGVGRAEFWGQKINSIIPLKICGTVIGMMLTLLIWDSIAIAL